VPVVKTSEQVEKMRISASLLSRCLDMLLSIARPGISGKALDKIAEEFIRDHGAIPAFKNYGKGTALTKFPASICFSRNHVLVHGIPTEEAVIQDGDIITIDCGLSLDGWFADAARLFDAGNVLEEDSKLIDASRATLQAGIDQKYVAKSPYYNVVQFCGHAIGQEMHEDPQVPNFSKPGVGLVLEPNMVFCLEPMLKKTRTELGILKDHWTVVTLDKSRATHIEHMVLITENGPEILTL
jgi:methionyl aminopeptidase